MHLDGCVKIDVGISENGEEAGKSVTVVAGCKGGGDGLGSAVRRIYIICYSSQDVSKLV